MTKLTVWYDGSCPMCTREMAVMRRLDWRAQIEFVDVADRTTVCSIDPQLALARLHVMERGQLLSGAAAFAAMWRVIPPMKPLGLVARNRVILSGLERLYLAFLRARPTVQRVIGPRL